MGPGTPDPPRTILRKRTDSDIERELIQTIKFNGKSLLLTPSANHGRNTAGAPNHPILVPSIFVCLLRAHFIPAS